MKSPKVGEEFTKKDKERNSILMYILVALGVCTLVLIVFFIDQNKNLNKKEEVKAEVVLTPELLQTQKKNERDIKALALSISFAATSIFDVHKSYVSFCKDEVLATNLSNMKSYVDNLLVIQGKNNQSDADIKCMATDKSYAVSIVVLPPGVSTKLSTCLDSSGFVGSGKIGLKPLACIKE